MDDKDRTIKIQQNHIDKLEKDVVKLVSGTEPQLAQNVDTTNIATQTERVSFINKQKTDVETNVFFFQIFFIVTTAINWSRWIEVG